MTAIEIISVVKAFHEGESIEVKMIGGETWVETPDPAWDFSALEYRVTPKPGKQPRSVWIHVHRDGFIGSAWPSYELCKAGSPKSGEIVKFSEEI